MESPQEKPHIELGYRAPDELAGPTVYQVFGGVICSFLCLVVAAVGLTSAWWVAGTLFRFRIGSGDDDPPPVLEGLGYAFIMSMCFFAAYVMFGMSRRLFMGKRNARKD